MNVENISKAALVLVGHGSTENQQSSSSLRTLVARIRQARCFAHVSASFHLEEPRLAAAFEGITAPQIFVVPFFVSEGYFTEDLVPRELGFKSEGQTEFERVQKQGEQVLIYCKPVGTHDLMTEVILSRARTVVEAHPFPRPPPQREITLVIAGHGTERNACSRESVEHHADLIRRRGSYAEVRTAFMEEDPRIADCLGVATTRCVVVVPFFLSDGLHAAEDIPVLLGEPERFVRDRLGKGQPTWRNPSERRGRLVWYSAAVGTDPVISEVILERVREAARWVGTGE